MDEVQKCLQIYKGKRKIRKLFEIIEKRIIRRRNAQTTWPFSVMPSIGFLERVKYLVWDKERKAWIMKGEWA